MVLAFMDAATRPVRVVDIYAYGYGATIIDSLTDALADLNKRQSEAAQLAHQRSASATSDVEAA
jgi:hypothetical protein